jgi:Xaa-Pro aminopeptidase
VQLIQTKIKQAVDILNELGIDMWLTLCRESDSVPDPAIELISLHKVIWTTAFVITATGETTVLVGEADATEHEGSGLFDEVVVYNKDVGTALVKIIASHDPQKIAVNYSKYNITADGLSHGLYLSLIDWLAGTPYGRRLVTAEGLIARLRDRKTKPELRRIKRAAELAHQSWEVSLETIAVGMSEIEIAGIIDANIRKTGHEPSFETIVNAGTKTQSGHGLPTRAVLEKGDLLHVDFGVRCEDYCSDIQRVAYCRREGEREPPEVLLKAFAKIKAIIDETAKRYKTGQLGHVIDALARKMLADDGYPEYPHALGHQIGRAVHDGAAIVGPLWKRYGQMPCIPLETGNTFTVELGINIASIGAMSLEENLLVTDKGGRFFCPRQTELTLV